VRGEQVLQADAQILAERVADLEQGERVLRARLCDQPGGTAAMASVMARDVPARRTTPVPDLAGRRARGSAKDREKRRRRNESTPPPAHNVTFHEYRTAFMIV
jgi:hypothetical protein